jgi:hypothetical protein
MCAWRHGGLGAALFLSSLWLALAASGQGPAERTSSFPGDGEPPAHPFHRAIYLSARRGADWLAQMNRPDGLFVYGHIPALNRPLDGDHYLDQITATVALARAARFFGDARGTARARQAILTLLADTQTDPADPQARFCRYPPSHTSRPGAAGLLVLAIHELPEPQEDLLTQAEQLCHYLRKQQQQDGSFKPDNVGTSGSAAASLEEDRDHLYFAPGLALQGLMRSQLYRPAAWKTEAARKALAYYRPAWQKLKNPAVVPWLTGAFTEAYLHTKVTDFADFVFEMNDVLCGLQYGNDAPVPVWQGGFKGWHNQQVQKTAPRAVSACSIASLADACRVARQAGEVQRFQRYRNALERGANFLTTLQYTAQNTDHFAETYRSQVYGAFHAAHQDGNVRIDYTGHAVCALLHYLHHVAEIAPRGNPAAPPVRARNP